MIKTITISLIFILSVSCSNKYNNSFDLLTQSFVEWYKKCSLDYVNFKTTNHSSLNNQFIGDSFYSDIKRFSIELNQIYINKLTEDRRNPYLLLNGYLSYHIFKFERMKDQEWNILSLLDEIYLNILHLSVLHEKDLISLDIIKNDINFISLKIKYITKNIKYKYSDSISNNLIIHLLNKIDSLIIHFPEMNDLKSEIEKLRDWYEQHYNNLSDINKDILKSNYIKYLSTQLGNVYIDSMLNSAVKSIKKDEKKLFNLSLPIYLSNNDEPVWTDYQDTLNIINWMTNNINNLNNLDSSCYNEEKFLSISLDLRKDILDEEDNLSIDNISFESSSITDERFYLHNEENGSFIAFNYMDESNPVKLYTQILEDLFPGDLYIKNIINRSDSRINRIITNTMYLESYKNIIIDDHINFLSNNENYFTDIKKNICARKHAQYSSMLEMQYTVNRIKYCIATIANINYHYYDISVNETINNYNYLNIFYEDDIRNLMIEIFRLGIDSIIKFKSYNSISNLLFLNGDQNNIIKIFKNNPNIGPNKIISILRDD